MKHKWHEWVHASVICTMQFGWICKNMTQMYRYKLIRVDVFWAYENPATNIWSIDSSVYENRMLQNFDDFPTVSHKIRLGKLASEILQNFLQKTVGQERAGFNFWNLAGTRLCQITLLYYIPVKMLWQLHTNTNSHVTMCWSNHQKTHPLNSNQSCIKF